MRCQQSGQGDRGRELECEGDALGQELPEHSATNAGRDRPPGTRRGVCPHSAIEPRRSWLRTRITSRDVRSAFRPASTPWKRPAYSISASAEHASTARRAPCGALVRPSPISAPGHRSGLRFACASLRTSFAGTKLAAPSAVMRCSGRSKATIGLPSAM